MEFLVPIVILAAIIWGIIYLRRTGRRCRYCMEPTTSVPKLPWQSRDRLIDLIRTEGMPRDPPHYETCTSCGRLFDWRWFQDERHIHSDWDMGDRQCECGLDLKPPWAFTDSDLKNAFGNLKEGVIESLHSRYGEKGLNQRMYDRLVRDPVLYICRNCDRVYTWIQIGEDQVFQNVSKSGGTYDREPDQH